MSDTAVVTPVKRVTRRKTAPVGDVKDEVSAASSVKNGQAYQQLFIDLIARITEEKIAFEGLQKEIAEQREAWIKEQQRHGLELAERNKQEEIEKQREKELYEYETAKKQRAEEDAFLQKKLSWERELAQQKETLAAEKKELETLRKQVLGFEAELQKAIKETTATVEKELTNVFATEKKLREQEVKAEKEMLGLRIANLSQENERQTKEITALKQALEDATRQLKEVAVKVIESSSTAAKPPLAVSS